MVRRSSSQDGFAKRRKRCPFTAAGIKEIDYKDVETLSRFITERGKILPRRITGVSHYFQKKLTMAIKRARLVALLPFVAKE
jgi:small subunit ribosomal protein S18